jgi:hypothetical protein
LVLLTKVPFIRREFIKRIKVEMIRPFTGALARIKKS